MRITKYNTLLQNGVPTLVKEMATNYDAEDVKHLCDLAMMLNDVFSLSKRTEEYVYLIALSAKAKVVGVFEVSHGSLNSTLVGTREIFQKALLCNAYGIILAHNHPSGCVTPSNEDISLTRKVMEAGKLMDIHLWDHIIVGDGYYSFKENNLVID